MEQITLTNQKKIHFLIKCNGDELGFLLIEKPGRKIIAFKADETHANFLFNDREVSWHLSTYEKGATPSRESIYPTKDTAKAISDVELELKPKLFGEEYSGDDLFQINLSFLNQIREKFSPTKVYEDNKEIRYEMDIIPLLKSLINHFLEQFSDHIQSISRTDAALQEGIVLANQNFQFFMVRDSKIIELKINDLLTTLSTDETGKLFGMNYMLNHSELTNFISKVLEKSKNMTLNDIL